MPQRKYRLTPSILSRIAGERSGPNSLDATEKWLTSRLIMMGTAVSHGGGLFLRSDFGEREGNRCAVTVVAEGLISRASLRSAVQRERSLGEAGDFNARVVSLGAET